MGTGTHTFPTSPSRSGEQRKFVNPTPGWVGANIFGPDGKPTAIAVEPGGEVWLTPEEERMTAEAPRLAQDNPFVKEWEEPVEFDTFGESVRTVTRKGVLALSDEPARPVASDRFVPERASADAGDAVEDSARPVIKVPEGFKAVVGENGVVEVLAEEPAPEPEPAPAEETVKGADVPEPEQPAPQGQPSPDEIVGAPDAVEANDRALAEREGTAEQPVRSGAIPT